MTRYQRFLPLLALAVAGVWIFWLRWPSFGNAFWNLDEGIYATVGRTVLDGGVMYRDALDHRAPVCHYATALIFAFAGPNNVWAMHATLAGMIVLVAGTLLLLGRQWRDTPTGLWAAAVFAALSTDLLYVGDAYSVSCEWFLAFFATLGACWFWATWQRAGFWPPFLAGMSYALAFLSKQPGLLEVGAPVFLLVYVVATGRLNLIQGARVLGGLVSGFTVMTALVFAYFWWHDTLTDFYFYGWTYNLIYYGADTSLVDRLQAALALPRIIGEEYPLLLVAMIVAALGCLHRLIRDQPTEDDKAAQPAAFFLLCWLLLSAAGAASAGRVHAHYYIQAMPAITLAAAWFLGTVTRCSLPASPWWRRGVAIPLLMVVGWNLVAHPVKGRSRPAGGRDISYLPAGFIKAHTAPTDRIIVWGLYPDFYVYADRKPASKYIYTSFQTGVQPGKNTAAHINTDYGAVPGAVEAFVREIDASRPVFFLDSSLGPQRLFEKYPLHRYPALNRFVARHYAELEAPVFRAHGFRVLALKDSGRQTPLPLAGGAASQLAEPTIMGLAAVTPITHEYDLAAADTNGRLQRLELLVNGAVIDGVTLPPCKKINVKFSVQFGDLGTGRHTLVARATSATGETRDSAPLVVECTTESIAPDQRQAFALPTASPGPQLLRLRAPFGSSATQEDGAIVFFVHAPSLLSYSLPKDATRLTGRFGFKPGAYASTNRGRTDGAEFIVTLVRPNGQRTELLRRMLRPVDNHADRGEQTFTCDLPDSPPVGTVLELAIGDGPAGNSASDWTYWSGLLLITAR